MASSSEEASQWKSVHYTWVNNWNPCRENKASFKANRKILVDRCGRRTTAVLTQDDFTALKVFARSAAKNFQRSLKCTDESIMDWSVYTYLTDHKKTKMMYSFDSERNCARGDRVAVEQLQDFLEVLYHKYFLE